VGKAGNPRAEAGSEEPRFQARHRLLRRKAGNQRPKKGQSYGTVWHRR